MTKDGDEFGITDLVLANAAKTFVEHQSERIKRGLRAALSAGRWEPHQVGRITNELSCLEFTDAYRLPKHVREQFLAEVAAVEKDDQAEPLFLEAHVDAWLMDRYSVPRWCAPSAGEVPSLPRNGGKTPEGGGGFVSVAVAQRRFVNGRMSRKWWYRMAQTEQIVHHRVGDTILFRTVR